MYPLELTMTLVQSIMLFSYVCTQFLYYTIDILRFSVSYYCLQKLWGKSGIDSSSSLQLVVIHELVFCILPMIISDFGCSSSDP